LSISAKDPSISVNGSAYQPAVFGTNTITATGTNSSGAQNTATFLIDLVAPASTLASTTSGSGGLAFTGADLAALIGAALVLILLGVGIVTVTRRRANQTSEG
jgi:hypothetical protein